MKTNAQVELVELEQESLAAYKKSQDCEANPSSLQSKIENHQSEISSMPSLIAAFAAYQSGIGRSEATIQCNHDFLKCWLKYLAGKNITELSQVTPQVAAEYQTWIFNYRTRFGKPFTIQSQIVVINTLQVFYRYLVKIGKVLSNPTEIIKLPKESKRLPANILTAREMKKLLAQPDTSTVLGFRDRTIYEIMYSTGLRIGELLRLQVHDINLPGKLLTIRCGKGGKDRFLPLGETACKYIAEYLKSIRPLQLRSSIGVNLRSRVPAKLQSEVGSAVNSSSSEILFFNKAGKPLKKTGLWKKLMIYAQRAGIKKDVTVHTFRHTLATEMLKRGADLRQIQELLGHASLRTTQLYTHIVKGELKRIQAECHPREQTELPENFVKYRGRKYLTEAERKHR